MSRRCAGHGNWGCYGSTRAFVRQRQCVLHTFDQRGSASFTAALHDRRSHSRTKRLSFQNIRFFTVFHELGLEYGVFGCTLRPHENVGDLDGIGIPTVLHFMFLF